MFVKSLLIAATSIAAVRACTGAVSCPLLLEIYTKISKGVIPSNPISAPSVANGPVIGEAFEITWDNTLYPMSTVSIFYSTV
jgi:hypothetical protein